MAAYIGREKVRGNLDYSVSESNRLQALVKRKMMDISDKVYLLADNSKIQVRDFTRVASMDEIHVLITDVETLGSFINHVLELDSNVLQA